ncbi:MAG: DUF4424 family protein [Rhizobiales bacterium]|nr:DUF4424 family protein [Hyphomicrobiales bacterium]
MAYDPIDISLARQELRISSNLVRVTYKLRSKAKEPQQATMAFPMPPVPIQGGPDFLGGAALNEVDPRNYMHFAVTVDGQTVQTTLSETAYLGEADVGEALRAAGLPLLIAPDEASDRIASLPAEQFYPLEEARIVSRGGDDPPHFTPLWSYQATFEWRQSFPPGATAIEISYQPLVGIVDNPAEFFASAAMASKYCVDKGLRDEIAKRMAAGGSVEVVTLSYLAAMMPFWRGPIGSFDLTLDMADESGPRGKADRAASCRFGGGEGFSAENFTPSGNLDIAFIYFDTSP